MKVIAFYLPQFHEIPENNEWWGKGFTEWVNVKKAKPLFEGHRQPRVPKDNNYYDLSDVNVMRWQASLAKEYGLYGFCYYHYWFNGHMLLQKPLENMLNDKKVDIPFCICWANEHWTNAWVSRENKVLIEQSYGEKKEWKEHYDYLSKFFHDDRYIKEDNKPMIVIYRPDIVDCMEQMMDYWQELAKEDGFDGLVFAYQSMSYDYLDYHRGDKFDYDIEYQPGYARAFMKNNKPDFLRKIFRKCMSYSYKLGLNIKETTKLSKYDYKQVWDYIIDTPPISEKSIACAFVDWDNTPRRGNGGAVFEGMTPDLFESYLQKLIVKSKEQYKKDYMFIFAWNEWAEGGYLEPDEENGFRNLEAIRNALINTGEFIE